MPKLKLKRGYKPLAELPTWEQFADIVDRANGGDRLAISELEAILDGHPEIVARVADVGNHLEQDLISQLAKSDVLLKKSLQRWLVARHQELAKDPGCPVQQVAASRIIANELHLWLLQSAYPRGDKVPKSIAKFVERAKSCAERRLRTSLKSMAMLRKLDGKRPVPKAASGQKPTIIKLKRRKADEADQRHKHGTKTNAKRHEMDVSASETSTGCARQVHGDRRKQ